MPVDDPFAQYNTVASPILFPVGTRRITLESYPSGWHDLGDEPTFERIYSHKAIVRRDSNYVLNVVGQSYRLIPNHELFAHVEDTLCKQMQPHELAGVQVVDKASGHGRVCLREYVFPGITCTIGARSDIAFRLIVQNGYGGGALRIHSGAIEFYCSNGMIRGQYESAYRKHTAGLVVSGLGNVVERSLATFADSQNLWRKWVNTPVQHQAAMDLFRELAGSDRLRENLQHQYLREVDARGHNMWSVYSALTYYASHADGEFKLRSTVQEQDTVASTMLQRELTVAKWIDSDAWRKLEAV